MLGATWRGESTTFAVFSSVAAHGGFVELCLVAEDGSERRTPMTCECDIWSANVPGVAPGQAYGYRVTGPYEPARGLRFDPAVLLGDPYALEVRDGLSVVADTAYDWGADQPPRRPWAETILYETHVKGITAAHPGVPPELRGTYAGLAHPAVVDHLLRLGVSAVELMPVQQFVTEHAVAERGLTNYWGYSTIGFLAPHAAYSAGPDPITEFKDMVAALHAAGIEVILDVVYNHTGEGPPDAPALSFRGLANDVYYRSDPYAPGVYVDTTGTMNSLDVGRPEVLRLIMDSLRYWVTDMGVDGFRFDLAASLARQHGSVDLMSAFFALLYQDPVLSGVKLIAEPWDLGHDGYQVGRFPMRWAEWNDRYRDDVREFWRGTSSVATLAYRVAGSSDLYEGSRRGPDASVNFVTAHDGKTLADLVSYVRKHNEANGEGNRDGNDDDRAANFGVEGPTDDPAINVVRRRQRRNLLATLLVSQGVSMLLGGDELGRTQLGNNNAYCQDNPVSWYDWSGVDEAFVAFVARAVRVQLEHVALRKRTFLRDDVTWSDSGGGPMTDAAWADPANRFLAYVLDDAVLVVLNAGDEELFPLPGGDWRVVLDTSAEDGAGAPEPLPAGSKLLVPALTTLVAATVSA